MKHLSIWNMGTSKPWGRRLFSSKEMHALVGYVAQLEAELEQRRTQIAHLQPVYLEVCEENEALKDKEQRAWEYARFFSGRSELLRLHIRTHLGLSQKDCVAWGEHDYRDALLTGEQDA